MSGIAQTCATAAHSAHPLVVLTRQRPRVSAWVTAQGGVVTVSLYPCAFLGYDISTTSSLK